MKYELANKMLCEMLINIDTAFEIMQIKKKKTHSELKIA